MPRGKALGERDRANIAEYLPLLLDGFSIQDVADIVGLGYSSVYSQAKREGYVNTTGGGTGAWQRKEDDMPRGVPLTETDKAAVLAVLPCLVEGWTCEQVAELVGLSRRTITAIARENGYAHVGNSQGGVWRYVGDEAMLPPRGKRLTKEEEADIVGLLPCLLEGSTAAGIGALVGRGESVVRRLAHEHGYVFVGLNQTGHWEYRGEKGMHKLTRTSDEMKAKIEELLPRLLEGWTPRQIGKALGVAKHVVIYIAERSGYHYVGTNRSGHWEYQGGNGDMTPMDTNETFALRALEADQVTSETAQSIEEYEAMVFSDRTPRQREQTNGVPTLLDIEDADEVKARIAEAHGLINDLINMNETKAVQVRELQSVCTGLQERLGDADRELAILRPKAEELESIKSQRRRNEIQQSLGPLRKAIEDAKAYLGR